MDKSPVEESFFNEQERSFSSHSKERMSFFIEIFRGLKVPEILLSGHEKKIWSWRHEQAMERTKQRRPDLLEEEE